MRKKKFCLFSLTLSLSVLAVSCGSPKDANKENFTKAVEKSIKEHPGNLLGSGFGDKKSCFFPVNNQSPIQISISTRDLGSSRPIDKTAEQMDVLSKYGLFTKKNDRSEITPYGEVITKEYEITEQGKAKVLSTKNGNKFISYCKIAFKALTSYNEIPSLGKYADVKFTYIIEDVDAWAKDPASHNLFPQAKAATEMINQPIESRMDMVLLNESWVNPNDSLSK
jgi:hypothetical protein